MNPETRFSGHWIVALQGMGKTNCLLHMLSSDLQKDASVITMDAKGELTKALRSLNLGDRLVLFDPREPFAINPLDVPRNDIKRAVNLLEYIFSGLLDAQATAKQTGFLRSILRAVILAVPNPTLSTVQDVISNGPQKYKNEIRNLPPDLQDLFGSEWKTYENTREELKWRLRLLMENDIVRNIFNAPQTRFDLATDIMDAGKVFVCDNSMGLLHEDGAAFVGRFLLAQIWSAAMSRLSESNPKPVYVYIDEAHRVINNKIAQIIDECRSARIALILAHQRSSQIEDKSILGALENCAIKMANVDPEAPYFSRLLHIPEERMNTLRKGQFATHVRDEGSYIAEIPLASLPFPTMTASEQAAFREHMKSHYGPEPPPPPPPDSRKSSDSDAATGWS